MEANPYAAPVAEVNDEPALDAADLEARKASRGSRLAAVLLDGLSVSLVFIVPTMMMASSARESNKTAMALLGLILIAGGLALLIVNCLFLHRNAQTIGKRLLGIKVVRTDGSRIGLGRIFLLRFLPISVVGVIPLIGRLSGLVDALFIFGAERRCLHDIIADTIVIRAD